MKTKRILTFIILMAVSFSVTASANDTVEINIKSPSGIDGKLTLPTSTKIADFKNAISSEFGINFGEDLFLYCEDIGSPNTKLPDDTKTLSDYNFESGRTVHVEQKTWDSPVKIFV